MTANHGSAFDSKAPQNPPHATGQRVGRIQLAGRQAEVGQNDEQTSRSEAPDMTVDQERSSFWDDLIGPARPSSGSDPSF